MYAPSSIVRKCGISSSISSSIVLVSLALTRVGIILSFRGVSCLKSVQSKRQQALNCVRDPVSSEYRIVRRRLGISGMKTEGVTVAKVKNDAADGNSKVFSA